MAKSKKLEIVLENGDPKGFRTGEIRNRISKAIAFPRAELSIACADKNLNRPGVYVLVGDTDPTNFSVDIYIGESDDLEFRLKQHYADRGKKGFWKEAYVVFSHDKSITKVHVMYLEYLLIQHAVSISEINVVNDKSGKNVNLSKSEIEIIEDFFEDSLLLFSVLGLNALGVVSSANNVVDSVVLGVFEMNILGASATMVETNKQFVIQKGSTARANETPSAGDSVRNLRAKLVADGTLIPKGTDLLEFTKDCTFAKISAAASVVAGGNQNGNQTWVVKGTKTTYGSVASQNGSS